MCDRTNLMGRFAEHTEAWTSGDWEPNETDGWHPASVDDLTVIATWDAVHGVTLQVHRRSDRHSRSFVDEFEVELHLRRRDLNYAREGYEGVVSH
ncbi:hypothetical protein ABT120_09485 [Nonomuraea angiospora]|uniref:hypothetical protein n=1 Tax=Nonomuraea angiospora TaxID=46172 RepID=UPI00331F0CC8